MRSLKKQKQSGQVIVTFAFFMVALIGAVGLAIDSGMGYMSKAKLNAAVDSAAVAAARAVVKGANQAEQTELAQKAASEFFAANYPLGYLNSKPTLHDTSIAYAGGGITINVSASAAMPTTFMRVMGFNELKINSNAQTIRKDLDLAFVVDTSGSMNTPGVPFRVKEASKAFLDKLNPTTDRVALIQFAHGAKAWFPFKEDESRGFDRQGMKDRIEAFDFAGSTNSAEGLWHAYDQLKRKITKPSSLRVIVFFSDGSPNSFSSLFDFNPNSNCLKDGKSTLAGTVSTSDATEYTSSDPYGLNVYKTVEGYICKKPEKNAESGTDKIAGPDHVIRLPEWYNAHDVEGAPKNEFRITAPRAVNLKMTDPETAWVSINRASRNLAETIAKKARQEKTVIFTIGLGKLLKTPTGPDLEHGDDLLRCLANDADAKPACRSANEPVGQYCYAALAKDLTPCFDQIASAILRITK